MLRNFLLLLRQLKTNWRVLCSCIFCEMSHFSRRCSCQPVMLSNQWLNGDVTTGSFPVRLQWKNRVLLCNYPLSFSRQRVIGVKKKKWYFWVPAQFPVELVRVSNEMREIDLSKNKRIIKNRIVPLSSIVGFPVWVKSGTEWLGSGESNFNLCNPKRCGDSVLLLRLLLALCFSLSLMTVTAEKLITVIHSQH